MYLERLHTLFVFIAVLTLINPPTAWCQGDAANADLNYEKVLLNGKAAYRNTATGKFLPAPPEGIYLHEIYTPFVEPEVYTDCWDNNRFKAYPNEDLNWPIHIKFDDSSYAVPINRPMVVTSRYGWRAGKAHHGIDIDLITGDLVMALLPGKVRLVQYVSGMGKTVVVRHENGLETVYGHLSKQFVSENDYVEKGQALGRGGTTGNARGSHLHLEVRYRGKSINPEYLFDFREDGRILAPEKEVTKYWASPRKHRSTRKTKIPTESSELLAVVPSKELKSTKNPVKSIDTQRKELHSEIASNVDVPIQEKRQLVQNPIYRIPVLSAPDLGDDKVYVVQNGDTLFSIAKRYDVPVSDICEKNQIGSNYLIKVGQALVLGD